jgi:hypothetical protein
LSEVRDGQEKHDGLSIPEIDSNIPSEGPISQASCRVVWATMILEEDKILGARIGRRTLYVKVLQESDKSKLKLR